LYGVIYFEPPRWFSGKESACSTGDACSILRSGISPGEGNNNPLCYSFLEILWIEKPGNLESMEVSKESDMT